MSGAGNYCRTDSALPQSAAGAGPRSSTGLGVAGVGAMRGWGGGGGYHWGGGGVVAPDPRAYIDLEPAIQALSLLLVPLNHSRWFRNIERSRVLLSRGVL